MGIEEISGSAESLAFMLQTPLGRGVLPPCMATASNSPGELSQAAADTALALACHISEVGVGCPQKRGDLLLQIKNTLGAAAFAFFERTGRGKLLMWERVGEFSPGDMKVLISLATDTTPSRRDQLALARREGLLLVGREAWFLGAKFTDESLAQEGWRKDLLRFLAYQFFAPVRSLDEMNSAEASRVLALAKGNKRKAALLLDISPGKLYKLLSRISAPKY
jgi:hypothetical protein